MCAGEHGNGTSGSAVPVTSTAGRRPAAETLGDTDRGAELFVPLTWPPFGRTADTAESRAPMAAKTGLAPVLSAAGDGKDAAPTARFVRGNLGVFGAGGCAFEALLTTDQPPSDAGRRPAPEAPGAAESDASLAHPSGEVCGKPEKNRGFLEVIRGSSGSESTIMDSWVAT